MGRSVSYSGRNCARPLSSSVSTSRASASPPAPPSAHTLHSATGTPSCSTKVRTISSSAVLSLVRRLMATTTGTPNCCTLRTWCATCGSPRSRASTSSRSSSLLGTPPCILSERTVATSTAASGVSPPARHLMSKNFSAPRSLPKPASVTTMSPSASPARVAARELHPCAMLPKGPACRMAGPPSSVCTRLGRSASLSSSVMAPVAPSSRAYTGFLSLPRVVPTMMLPSRCSRSSASAARATMAMISLAGMITHRSSRMVPLPVPTPMMALRRARSFMSIVRGHVMPLGLIPNALPW